MSAEGNYITTEVVSIDDVTNHNGLGKGYSPVRSYFGTVYKSLESQGCAEHIDEKIFFRAAQKLGKIYKAKITREDGENAYSLDKDSNKYLPPEEIAIAMADDKESKVSVYMRHNGNWGVNLASPDLMIMLTSPIVKLLCEFNTASTKMEEELDNVKKALREAGLSVRFANSRDKRIDLINKFFN